MGNHFPLVSMLIVVRNAGKYIEKSIMSLINQGFEKNQYEIIISDGASSDNTLELSKKLLEKENVNYQILKNEKKILASGWNLALQKANGKYVVRPDAHSELLNGYVKKGINKLENDEKLAGVGGILIVKSENFIGNMIAKVLSNPIGVGTSLFRVGVKKDTYSDTAVFAVYKTSVFDECGYFDESLHRNQDIDMHKRIMQRGYKFLTSPDMIAYYYCRSNIQTFIKQAYSNGFWITKSKTYHFRHLVPLLFVLALVLSTIVNLKITITTLLFYTLVVEISFMIKKTFNIISLQVLLLLTFGLHISYGFGSVYGFVNNFLSDN